MLVFEGSTAWGGPSFRRTEVSEQPRGKSRLGPGSCRDMGALLTSRAITPQTASHNMNRADYCLDASGLICPEPLMLVRNKVREMKAGEVLHVLATDPSTERDLTNFCRFMGHQMLSHELRDSTYHYHLRKG